MALITKERPPNKAPSDQNRSKGSVSNHLLNDKMVSSCYRRSWAIIQSDPSLGPLILLNPHLTLIYRFKLWSTNNLTSSCFQGKALTNNATAGIIVANQTLVLQSINRHHSGHYTCVAANSEGTGESNSFHLDVKCKYTRAVQIDCVNCVQCWRSLNISPYEY